jgi:hypothetical protein
MTQEQIDSLATFKTTIQNLEKQLKEARQQAGELSGVNEKLRN